MIPPKPCKIKTFRKTGSEVVTRFRVRAVITTSIPLQIFSCENANWKTVSKLLAFRETFLLPPARKALPHVGSNPTRRAKD